MSESLQALNHHICKSVLGGFFVIIMYSCTFVHQIQSFHSWVPLPP